MWHLSKGKMIKHVTNYPMFLCFISPHHEITTNWSIGVSRLGHPCPQLLFSRTVHPFHSTIGRGVTWQSTYYAALGPQHLILLITSLSSTAFNLSHLPWCSPWVIAVQLNSLPLSDCRIIGGPMMVKILSRATVMQLACFLFSGMLKRNLTPWPR